MTQCKYHNASGAGLPQHMQLVKVHNDNTRHQSVCNSLLQKEHITKMLEWPEWIGEQPETTDISMLWNYWFRGNVEMVEICSRCHSVRSQSESNALRGPKFEWHKHVWPMVATCYTLLVSVDGRRGEGCFDIQILLQVQHQIQYEEFKFSVYSLWNAE